MTITTKPQYRQGKDVEDFLDEWFRCYGWQIERTTAHEERVLYRGDRRFARDGVRFFVEYKSGIQTFYTGNVFLETVSVDTQNKPGWVFTSQADFILYAALLNEKILVFVPDRLRQRIEDLRRQFREVATSHGQNDGYKTHGVIVPLAYAERHLAVRVLES